MKKILCLPGFATNKEFNDFQLRRFRKYFPDYEFISIDPFVLLDKTVMLHLYPELLTLLGDKNIYSWIDWNNVDFSSESLNTINKLIDFINENGSFEGLLGFSQGAIIIHHLLEIEGDKKLIYKPNFCFLICSHLNFALDLKFIPTKLFNIKSVHFIGVNDNECFRHSIYSTIQYINPLIIESYEDHKFPKLDQKKINSIQKYLNEKNSVIFSKL